MPKDQVTRKGRQPAQAAKDRRLGDKRARLRRMWRLFKGFLRRPLGFMRNNGNLRFGFLERRLAPPDALSAAELRADLRARMLAYPPDHAAHMLRHLVQVHDELGHGGWAAVQALPASVLGKALFQAQLLQRDGPSPALNKLIERLRQIQPAPAAAPTTQPPPAEYVSNLRARPTSAEMEVSEASQEDFDATSRSWFGNLPPQAPESPETPEARR